MYHTLDGLPDPDIGKIGLSIGGSVGVGLIALLVAGESVTWGAVLGLVHVAAGASGLWSWVKHGLEKS